MSEAAGPTKRPMRPTDRVLNVWASARHQEARGAGPIEYAGVFREPPPPEASPPGKDCTRSDELYEGSPKKYEELPKSHQDPKVLSAIEAVEYVLADADLCPGWVRDYLLFRYPEQGRYVPERSTDGFDLEREFVEAGGMKNAAGGKLSRGEISSAASMVRMKVRSFVRQLVAVMALDDDGDGGKKPAA